MDWIHLAQDRGKWRAVAENSCSIKMRGISRLAENMLASQEGLCSMELVSRFICDTLLSHSYEISDSIFRTNSCPECVGIGSSETSATT
jgi:hypothetical protein